MRTLVLLCLILLVYVTVAASYQGKKGKGAKDGKRPKDTGELRKQHEKQPAKKSAKKDQTDLKGKKQARGKRIAAAKDAEVEKPERKTEEKKVKTTVVAEGEERSKPEQQMQQKKVKKEKLTKPKETAKHCMAEKPNQPEVAGAPVPQHPEAEAEGSVELPKSPKCECDAPAEVKLQRKKAEKPEKKPKRCLPGSEVISQPERSAESSDVQPDKKLKQSHCVDQQQCLLRKRNRKHRKPLIQLPKPPKVIMAEPNTVSSDETAVGVKDDWNGKCPSDQEASASEPAQYINTGTYVEPAESDFLF